MNAQGRIDDAQEKDYFQQVVEKKQNNMVKSSYRCLRLLAESEKVGAATGEVSVIMLNLYNFKNKKGMTCCGYLFVTDSFVNYRNT